MTQEHRPEINKRVITLVCLVSILCLVLGGWLGLWSTREVRRIVTEQFNEEQLLLCRSVSRIVENELSHIKKELLILRSEVSPDSPDQTTTRDSIGKSLARMQKVGLQRIDLIDPENRKILSYTRQPLSPPEDLPLSVSEGSLNVAEKACGKLCDALPLEDIRKGSVWFFKPQIEPSDMDFMVMVPLGKDSPWLLCYHLDVYRFLTPLVEHVRSGETGYVWIIDEKGIFLYHPDADLVGKDSFEARELKDPTISYWKINSIQLDKMLRGQEGTDWYFSGWHGKETGKVKKLIAYTPIFISGNPPQRWSAAIAAPISEIEKAFRSGEWRLLFFQGMVFLVIVSGAAAIVFFEVRWSQTLEHKVSQRTKDLKKSEERYRSLVESAEDFIFTVDSFGCFQSMNSFTANFFGGCPDEFVGKPMANLFTAEVADKELKLIRLVFRFGKSVRDDFSLRTGTHQISISANFMPLKDKAGNVTSVLCIARDITESKKLEKQLINTEKLASMGTLAAGVAHEINNPLGVILGFCDLLIEKAHPESREYKDLKTIERQGLLCKQVVENLLSFARQEKGELAYCELNGCLEEIIQVVQHTLGMNDIELHLSLGEGIPKVKADPRQLQQVFLNLINNAMGAMKGGGDLTITTNWDVQNQKAVAEFQDTGKGIREENMDRIFEPFFTTKPEGEGTGLGLFVSYGIISKYGGSLTCSSQTGDSPDKPRGTVFTVKLPVVSEEQ